MQQLIYVPGFNEGQSIFTTLKEIFSDSIEKCSLPGHLGEHQQTPFSMTATKHSVKDVLEGRKDITGVITTSLSAWPVIEALEETRTSVKKLLLINPAFEPMQSVVRMYNANPLIQKPTRNQEDFLSEDLEIFDDFLGGGRISGDSERFQRDLQRFSDMGFATENEFFSKIEALRDRGISSKVLYNLQDAIIFSPDTTQRFRNPGSCQLDDTLLGRKPKSEKQAHYSSHIPDFSASNKAMIGAFFQDN